MMVARPPVVRRSGCELLRARQELLEAIPRVCASPPCPGRHLVVNSVAIVHLREVGRSQRRDCISTAIRLHSVGSHSVTILH